VRKLIRPSLPGGRADGDRRGPRRELPPEATNAEAAYLQQAIQDRAVLELTLLSGQVLRARLEYYDRDCLKLEPEGGARLLLRKDKIKYYRVESAPGKAGAEAEAESPRPAGKAPPKRSKTRRGGRRG
jgi:hypothetical protein